MAIVIKKPTNNDGGCYFAATPWRPEGAIAFKCWTMDLDKAMLFASKKDAKQYCKTMGMDGGKQFVEAVLPVYIHAQDFVDAFIGPFANKELAQSHIDTVIIPRGDSGTLEIISEEEFKKESPGWLILTPEDDINFDPNA